MTSLRMRRNAGLVAALALLSASGSATPPARAIKSYTITIENMQFSPSQLSVQRGDRIVWVNKDLFPHTVTAGNKALDSGTINAGGSWTYVTDKPGEYAYSCTFHPTMKGAITVR